EPAEELSGWSDLPIGTYRVPDSQVIISGQQKPGVGMMFGLVGVALEHSMGKSAGRSAGHGSEEALHITLTEEGQRDLAALRDSADRLRILHVKSSDVLAPQPRDENHRDPVAGYNPFIKGRFEFVGYALAEDEHSIVFAPRIGDVNVIAGVSIMDKAVVTTRAA